MNNGELIKRMYEGDLRCSIPIGGRVEKVNPEEGDVHSAGATGVVTGSIYIPEKGSGYLVQFEGNPFETFVIENKLKQI